MAVDFARSPRDEFLGNMILSSSHDFLLFGTRIFPSLDMGKIKILDINSNFWENYD